MVSFLFFFSYDGEAVAQREDDALHGGVGGYEVVEGEDALKLRFLAIACIVGWGGIDNLAVPKGIVGDDETAGTYSGQHGVEIIDVVALVGIDEDEIK